MSEIARSLWDGRRPPSEETWDAAMEYVAGAPFYSAALMFAGIEFELLLKAKIITKIGEGMIKGSREEIIFRVSHNLTRLATQASIVLTEGETKLLETLSSYISWMGRYPSPKTEEEWDRWVSTRGVEQQER
jgi:hypothetical protein